MSVSHLKAAIVGGLLLLYLVVIEGMSHVLKWRFGALRRDHRPRPALQSLGDQGHGPVCSP